MAGDQSGRAGGSQTRITVVAGGTYTPHASDRTASFVLKTGVRVYGGYAGTGSLRDIAAYPVILTGDLAGNDNANINPTELTRAENAYHVVLGSGADGTTRPDGFAITGGNANGALCQTGRDRCGRPGCRRSQDELTPNQFENVPYPRSDP